MDIINKCKIVLQQVRNSVKDFKMDSIEKLSLDEQNLIDLFASRTVGDIVSALVEFAQNSINSPTEIKHAKQFNIQNQDEIFENFVEKVHKSVAFRCAQERDDFEIELLENGHDSRQSFALASNSIYKSINEQTDKMEPAMIDTISKIQRNETTHEPRIALAK